MSLTYDPDHPLFIAPSTRLRIDEAEKALDLCYQTGRPVLIYLHGRAKDVGEPKKSVNTEIYRELEAYGVAVLGFTWDADDPGYDENRAVASSDDFARLLKSLRSYLDSHNVQAPSLLAHSMGNIIVSEAAKDELLGPAAGTLITNLILTSAAVKTKRHAKWLDLIEAAERIFVPVNTHDLVLGFAGLAFRPNMLGKDLQGPGARSPKVTYVDISACKVNHRYFVPQGQNRHVGLKSLYADWATGLPPRFNDIAMPDEMNGVPVLRVV